MRLYADSAKCSGCRACLVACSLNIFQESNPKKASLNLIAHFPNPGVYEMKVCTQCGDCAAVCPTEAIKLNDRGAYYVDFAECNLCEACVPECPEDVMFVRTDFHGVPGNVTYAGTASVCVVPAHSGLRIRRLP
jgi:Fe-S-cluster-containing hydrogenase component 2